MSALRDQWPIATLTAAEAEFLRYVPSDTEDAPWMSMNDRQWRDASALFWSLETYAQSRGWPWYPGGMLPLIWLPPGLRRRKQVAPDVFVAPLPVQGHVSWSIDKEGMPPFVLEVVSSSSLERDLTEKTEIYRLLGAQEYAIVRPDLTPPRLEGFRRDASGAWVVWEPDADGRLWSAVLGLWLVMAGAEVRAMTHEGKMLLTPREEAVAHRREAAARREAEEELARLREVVARLMHEADNPTGA
jgi:hypothetical protein